MVQLLIVDDEIHSADGVKQAIDWETIGVDAVFTAYSMAQAQKVMLNEDIHIIISDVEMPRGSGFDLLHWIIESSYNPVIIMLTSYATFDYAKKAIEFQCLDYLLKPVSAGALLEVAKRAVNVVLDERKKRFNDQLAQYWNANERHRVRHFWREIIEQKHFPDSREIMAQAKEQHIIFDERNLYLPILYKIHPSDDGISWVSSAEELKLRLYTQVFNDEDQVVLVYNDLFILAIAGYCTDFAAYYDKFRSGSREFITKASQELKINISVYMGEFKESGAVAVQYVKLLKIDRDNVAERSGIYSCTEDSGKVRYERPDIEKWVKDFSDGHYDATVAGIENYIDELARERRLNQDILTQFLQDFMQAFYIAVGAYEIQAHLLFEDETSVDLYQRACTSIKDFKLWIRHIVDKASSFIGIVSDTKSVILHIKRYIKNNLSEELNRNKIAGEACMSPDYVSRIFRQETGIQLTEYITNMRMEEARRLLISTSLPIGEIAYKVGYYNIAYFSRVFRIRNRRTPAEYRAECGADSDDKS